MNAAGAIANPATARWITPANRRKKHDALFADRYKKEVVPVLQREFSYSNVMQIPRVRKVVLNVGCGEAIDNPKALEAAVGDVTAIAGQKPVVTKAKKSVANFKLREGQANRRHGHPARGTDVVVPRPADERRASRACAISAGCRRMRSTGAATTPSGSRNS